MKNKKIKIRELEDIIKNKRIYPVFQPIVLEVDIYLLMKHCPEYWVVPAWK